ALVPLSPHLYEAVPLMLVARSRQEMLALTVCGTLGGIAGALWPPTHVPDHGPRQWAIVFLAGYLPALIVVLRHRLVSGRAPSPVCGHPTSALAGARAVSAPRRAGDAAVQPYLADGGAGHVHGPVGGAPCLRTHAPRLVASYHAGGRADVFRHPVGSMDSA